MSLIKIANQTIQKLAQWYRPKPKKFGKFPFSTESQVSDDNINYKLKVHFDESYDGWEIRQAMNDLMGYDMIPEPPVIKAVLLACRRVDDYALSVRFLEAVKNKCGNHVNTIWPYIVQEIAPTLCEIGCDLPETLGYDKPELWCPSVYNM